MTRMKAWCLVVLAVGAGCGSKGGTGCYLPPCTTEVDHLIWPLLDAKNHVGHSIVFVGTGAEQPHEVTCYFDPSLDGGPRTSAFDYTSIPLEVREVVVGDIHVGDRVNGCSFPERHQVRMMEALDAYWSTEGVYVLDRLGIPSECNQGDERYYSLELVSWLDRGGPGWFSAADVKALANYIREHDTTELTMSEDKGLVHRLQLWIDVTGKPLPPNTMHGPDCEKILKQLHGPGGEAGPDAGPGLDAPNTP